MAVPGSLHHIELYVASLNESSRFWSGFLSFFGYAKFQEWDKGLSFKLEDSYIVLVQVEAENAEPKFHRQRVGLNHLAFHAASRAQVNVVTDWVLQSGFSVLYQDRHPYAGGANHYALYCEDPNRIKVELVAPSK